MTAPILLSLLMTALTPADTIRVGEAPMAIPLTAGVDTVDNYVLVDGERRLVAISIQAVTTVEGGYRIVQENLRPSGQVMTLDSIVVTEENLATVWHGDVTPLGRRHLRFSAGRASGIAIDTLGVETPIDERADGDRFDYSIMSIVIDRLPLEAGYEATLQTFDITRGPVDVTFRVVGAESIRLGQTTFDTWKTEVDLGPQTVVRWIERSTGRELRWSLEAGGREMFGERRLH